MAQDPQLDPENKFSRKDPLRCSVLTSLCDAQLASLENRVERVLHILSEQNLIDKDSVVLDMGCGTGVFALPLAKMVKRVDALDISAPITEALREKLERGKVSNVRIIQADWRDFARKSPGGRYHLVISSLNSSMYNGQAILEMTRLSKGGCLFSSPCGRAENHMLRYLDALILEPKPKPEIDCRDIIYPFNILYYLGYKPRLEYLDCAWSIRESPPEAVARLIMRYEEFTAVTAEMKGRIGDFVYEHQTGGVFEEDILCHFGFLTWHVTPRAGAVP